MTKVSFVWAEDEAGWIGKNGQLPWRLPVDMKHFQKVTVNHPIVMGAATYQSIGRPLPKRTNIVVSHHRISNPEVITVSSIDELRDLIKSDYPHEEVCIIGGAGLFAQTVGLVNYLHRTVVAGDHQGDVKMIPLDYRQWSLVSKKEVPTSETSVPNCRFEEWQLNEEKDSKVN